MDPINPANFPILSYVIGKLPSMKATSSTSAADFDVEKPPPPEPHFELSEKMPHLKNPKLIAAMQRAVGDIAQTRSVLQALGPRPDHEALEEARSRLSEIHAASAGVVDSDYKRYKAVVAVDEMHGVYEKMLAEAERRLETIYEAAVAGVDLEEEAEEARGVETNEEVVAILREAEMGKEIERVDLSGRRLSVLPEAFGRVKSLVVLNLSNNQLEAIPDSVAGLENLEELNLSTNHLEFLPDSIGLLLKLKILDVSRNKLVALPDSITHCKSLQELDASFNKLTYLPTNIGLELVNLKRLSIQLNKIRSLPTSIGDMRSLRLLDVHFNELHTLPPSIGKLTNLEILNLSSNFSDLIHLPDAISDLTSLKELDLSNNQIHALPDRFGQLMNLTKLNLDQNPLEIPPQNVANAGVEAVKTYMTKRWVDIVMAVEEEKSSMHEVKDQTDAGLLTRSTSWLKSVVSNLGGAGKSDADRYLNQEF